MIVSLLLRYPRTMVWYVVTVYTAAMVGELWPR